MLLNIVLKMTKKDMPKPLLQIFAILLVGIVICIINFHNVSVQAFSTITSVYFFLAY